MEDMVTHLLVDFKEHHHALQLDDLYEKETDICVQLVSKKYGITHLISENCCLCVGFLGFCQECFQSYFCV